MLFLVCLIAVAAAQNYVTTATYSGSSCVPSALQYVATVRLPGACLARTNCSCAGGFCLQTWCSTSSEGLIVPPGAVGFFTGGTTCNLADATVFTGFGRAGCVSRENIPTSYSIDCSNGGLRVRTYAQANCGGTPSEFTYSGCTGTTVLTGTTCTPSAASVSAGTNTLVLRITFDSTVSVAQAAALQSALLNYTGATTVTVTGGGTNVLVVTFTGPSIGSAGATIVGTFSANLFQSLVVRFSTDTSVAALPPARSVTTGASGLLASLLLLACALFLFF